MRGRSSIITAVAVVAGATVLASLVASWSARAGALPPAAPRPSSSGKAVDPSPSAIASAQPAPAAPPILTDDAMPRRSDRVVAYTLEAELFPDTHSVRGAGTIVWRNTSRVPADRVFVHLYLNAFKSGRTVFWRSPLDDFRGDPLDGPGRIDVEKFYAREMEKDLWPESPATPGDPQDATDIEIPLPRPIAPGDSLTIDMKWTSHLPTVTIRTGYSKSFHMVAQWFPKLARLEEDGTWSHFPFQRLSEFYADYGTYDVAITAPKSFVVGAVGALVSEDPAPDAPAPAPAETAAPAPSDTATSTASAPTPPAEPVPRTQRRYHAEDVHDFAFTAWDRFRALDDVSEDGVKIRCLFPEGYDTVARSEIDQVKFGLGYLGAAFGRYPYGTLTIVHPPSGAGEAGGMEYPTLITTGGLWWSGPLDGRDIEIVTIHELAHQWFYGLVGTNENRWPFLDEGLTTYAEADALEAQWPDASAAEVLGLRVGMPAIYRVGALRATRHVPVQTSAGGYISGEDYGALVYSRTGTALRTLGNVYGEALVRRAIGAYARRYRFAHPGPEQLFQTIREVVGEGAEAALRAALMEPTSVDYIVSHLDSDPREDGKPGYEGHVLVRRLGEIRLPVDVLFVAEDGTTQRIRWDAARAAEWLRYEGDEPLAAAVIDPEHRVLLDEDLSNNAKSAAGRTFAWRVLEASSFAGGLFARSVLP